MKREDCKKGMVVRHRRCGLVRIRTKPNKDGLVRVDEYAYSARLDIADMRPLTAREKGQEKP